MITIIRIRIRIIRMLIDQYDKILLDDFLYVLYDI